MSAHGYVPAAEAALGSDSGVESSVDLLSIISVDDDAHEGEDGDVETVVRISPCEASSDSG